MKILKSVSYGLKQKKHNSSANASAQGPLLLTWFNFNPGMDK